MHLQVIFGTPLKFTKWTKVSLILYYADHFALVP